MSDIQIKYMQQGWECPKCGRVYSPYTIMCQFCGAEEKTRTFTNPALEGKSISLVALDESAMLKVEEDKDE